VVAQCGTSFEPIANSVDRSAVDPALITNDCGLPVVKYAYILVYNAESFPDKQPTSTADFFDKAVSMK
jgi:putative spermidine/putrescine transport system substrate-binding protein